MYRTSGGRHLENFAEEDTENWHARPRDEGNQQTKDDQEGVQGGGELELEIETIKTGSKH